MTMTIGDWGPLAVAEPLESPDPELTRGDWGPLAVAGLFNPADAHPAVMLAPGSVLVALVPQGVEED